MRALQLVDLPLGPDLKELTVRGTPVFPCAAYDEDLDKFINGAVPWHWHEELEFILVCSGSMRISCGEETGTVESGDGIFINSNVLHTARRAGESLCRITSLVFKPELVCGFPQSVTEQAYIQPLMRCTELSAVHLSSAIQWQQNIIDCVRAAFQSYNTAEIGYEMLVQAELIRALFYIVSHNQKQISDGKPAHDKDLLRVKTMLEFIHNQYATPISVAKLSRTAHVSESECYRCFNKVLGITPAEYMIQFRIRVASGLLADTTMSVAKICHASGFNSPSYFAKVFKEHTGLSPSAYREKMAAN